ncbi:uncharacterized protein LOC131207160 [Anopheles bellator]|uniref:uncharacterized protein LOC131207160 n=1 Tax=Anopheles bellator TaxID=139047 RepID=UPI002648AA33|nr:uncharacterized protein LOC131207160 [Anopheles bellator]
MFRAGMLQLCRVVPRFVLSRNLPKCTLDRTLHVSARQSVKKFLDSENDYASAFLHRGERQCEICDESAVDMGGFVRNSMLDNPDPERLLKLLGCFVVLVNRDDIPVDDERFADFVKAFVNGVPDFADNQLAQALKLLSRLEDITSIYDTNYLNLWTSLDGQCLARIAEWDTDKLLQFADLWYPLRLTKQGKYVNKALWKISNRLRKLPPQTLVKTVFYINLTRVPMENMMDIEINFGQNFGAFSIDDVAVLCMGFFKTETPIRGQELLEKIYDVTIRNVASVEDIPLTAILKLLRYSSRIPSVASMEALLTALVPQIPRLSTLACLHVALLGTDIHVCHNASLEMVVDKFNNNLPSLRLKDMERIAFVLAHNNTSFATKEDTLLCHGILEQLPDRIAEIVTYPRCYIALLHFLTLRNVYNMDYISAAFEKQFLRLAYNKNIPGAGREAVSLDAFVAISLRAQYGGNRFPAGAFKIVCKLTQDYLPNPKYRLTKSDRMLLDIQRTFCELRSHCRIMHLLPHFQRPDILFCWDSQAKRVLDLSDIEISHEIMTREMVLKDRHGDSNIRLVAIVVGSWNCYVRDVKRRTGGYAMKLKQLRTLGYEVVEIPWYEWPVYSRDDMLKYLKGKLSSFY